jgi:hypothetical protein
VRLLARLIAAPAVTLLLVCAPAASAAPPANDLFASAELVTGSSVTASGTTVDASKETAEPNHRGYSGGRSIWYRWVAPADGTAVVSVSSSTYGTLVAAYTGLTVDGLTPVGTGGDLAGLRFSAVAGQAYHIAIDTYGDGGPVELTLSLVDRPANDDFADAEELTGTSDSATGDTTAATREPGEPYPSYSYGAGSVWYEWTAPSDGAVAIDTAGSDFNTVLGVYTGDDVAGLVHVASNDDASSSTRTSKVTFRSVAGTTYRILVDGYYTYDLGQVQVSVDLQPPPPNDMFATPTLLPGEAAVTAGGSNAGASVEPGEPSHHGSWYYSAQSSVWYSWTAPKSGSLTVKAAAGFQTVLAVYRGESVSELTRVVNQPQDWNGGPEQIRVRVEAGVTYSIVVDGYAYYSNQATGEFSLSLTLIDSPPNDDFDDAEVVLGLEAQVEGSNVGATQEPCEPVHDDNYYDPSVWYEWTAPASGGVTLDTTGSAFNTVLGIYTGDALCELVRVPTTRTSPANVPAKRRFRAAAGVTYRIAVDGAGARWGDFKLSFDYTAPPANDMFAAAEILTGETASTTGDNIGATGEGGEPNPGGTAGASVWYAWTAPKTGLAVLQLPTDDFDPGLTVYTGDAVDALTPVSGGSDGYGLYTFRADEGTTYRIAVHGGDLPSRGEFSLALEVLDAPPNDDFANAIELTGSAPTVDGTTTGGTREPNEPYHGYSYYAADNTASVWYEWTAPSSGKVTLSRSPASWAQALAVYTGDSLGSLSRIASDYYDTPSFQAVEGTTYRIAVAGAGHRPDGGFALTLEHGAAPNDAFAAAEELSGSSDSTTGSNRNASVEPGEPYHYYSSTARSSVWYRWTAPSDGTVVVDLSGSTFDTVHAVYTGSSVDALTSVASSDYEQLSFTAEAGTTYHVAVDGYSYYSLGSVKLALTLQPAPANDDFADAEELSGAAVDRAGTTGGATREPGEPYHYNGVAGSVWYRWTAPTTANVHVSLGSWNSYPGLAVYSGASLDSLTTLASAGPHGASFVATEGETYWIAVEGYYTYSVDFTLVLAQEAASPPPESAAPPPNQEQQPPPDQEQLPPPDQEQQPPPEEQQPPPEQVQQPPPEEQQPAPEQEQQPPAEEQQPPPGAEQHEPPPDDGGSAYSPPPAEAQQSPPPPGPPAASPTPPGGPGSAPLSVSAAFPAQKLAPALASAVMGTATCSVDCLVDVVVTLDPAAARKAGLRGAKRTTAHFTTMARGGAPATLRLRLPKAARTRLRGVKSVKLAVRVTARSGGQTDVVTTSVKLKR